MNCPECGRSDLDMTFHRYDFGRDPETGYVDAGTAFVCPCGATGEAE